MIQRLRPWLRELGGEPTVVLCGASALLVVSHYQGSNGAFQTYFAGRFDTHPAVNALGYFWWFGMSLVLYLGLPLLLAYATRGSFHRRYGLGLGDVRVGLAITGLFLAVMLPLTAWASTLSAFKGQYPLAGNAAVLLGGKVSVPLFVAYEAAYFAYFVSWEFFFRGWMLNGLLPTWGRGPAILVQMAPFVVMHLGKPELEALGSIVAGIALGVLALRTRSMWYGALIHGVIAVWMDVLSAWPTLNGR